MQLISHKLLRWLTPLFLLAALTSSVFLTWQHWIYTGAVAGQLCFYALGMAGWMLERLRIRSRWLSFPCYFVLMSVASIAGILKYLRGEKINIWEPERAGRQIAKREGGAVRWACLLTSCGLLMAAIGLWPRLLFWIALGMMLYTYIGYPVFCALLSGFLSQPWYKDDGQPTVTLLIIAHNEEESLAAKIENSLALDYPQSRLVIAVASDGSTDGTNAILCRYEEKGIRAYYFPEHNGKMATINRIFLELQTDIVVLSDANVMYESDVIKKLVRNFADDGVGAVSGKVTLISDQPVLSIPERLYYRYEWFIKRLESQTGSLIGVDGAMYGIRRELFQRLPDNVVLDDFVISMNIAKRGKRVVYEPDAKAHETSAASLAVELQRRSRIAAGAIQSLLQGEGLPRLSQPLLLFKYLSHKILRWSTPVFLIMLLLANLFLLGEYFYNVTFGGQVAFYLAAFVGKLQKSPASIFAVPLYICGTNLAAAYGLVRGILNQQKGSWDRLERASWAL
jgi:cellulose synthase/poly-beta-1,6-N-acetylglucosamine synthase-like glycosyltransferase